MRGVVRLESSNGLPVTMLHVPTTRKGTCEASKRTVQKRSQLIETLHQIISIPSTSASTSTSTHVHTQLTSVIKRNRDMFSSCASAAGINIMHRFSVDTMLEFHKLISAPYSLIRDVRSFLLKEGTSVNYHVTY
jgi:hypothetical protein